MDETRRVWLRRAGRGLLAVAVAMSAVYALQILLDLARPKLDAGEPAIGLLGPGWPAVTKAVFWCVLASWLTAAGIGGWALVQRRRGLPAPWPELDRWGGVAMLVAVLLVAPYPIYPLTVLLGHLDTVLVCVPSTAFAVWGVRRMQRFRRLPVRLLLGLFGWGLLVATGFGGVNNIWLGEYSVAYFGHAGTMLQVLHRVQLLGALGAGVFEETGKAAVLVLVYLLARRHLNSVVAGITAGAAVGLGFNLTESVEYMSASHGVAASFQYWMRQSVGLMGAHTAFTAICGAGLAVAAQLSEVRLRRWAIGCGLSAAIGGHFAANVLLPWLGQHTHTSLHAGPTADVLLVQPLLLVLLQGPFVAMYLLLLRRGTRTEATSLAQALHAEAATGRGAVTAAEVPILLAPTRRFWLQATVLHRYGWTAYRTLLRLHATQYELATAQGQAAEQHHDPPPPAGELHERIRQTRADLSTTITGQKRPAEAMA